MEGQAGDSAHGDRRPSRLPGSDISALRISDADRHAVAEVLREAAGEGRLDLEELEERLEATYAARTYADLVPITQDLPAGLGRHAAPYLPGGEAALPVPSPTRSVAVMGDCTRRGVWEVPEHHVAFSLMGGVTLDLREARFAASEVVIEAYAMMAGVDVVVNPSTRVIVEGLGVMGEFKEARAKVPAELTLDSPVVRVKGLALMAGVSVKRKPMPGPPRKFLGRS